MWFWWFMFICDLLIPFIMIIIGKMMWKHSPKKINFLVGYRTTRSMKNMDTWKFAHEYCGKLWCKVGWIMFFPSLLVNFPFYYSTDEAIEIVGSIIVTIQCVVLVFSIIPTEKALKKTFKDDGTRR